MVIQDLSYIEPLTKYQACNFEDENEDNFGPTDYSR